MLEMKLVGTVGENYHITSLPDGSDRLIPKASFNHPKQIGPADATRLWMTGYEPIIKFYDALINQEVGSVPLPESSSPWKPCVSVSRDETRLLVAYQGRSADSVVVNLAILDIKSAKLIEHRIFNEIDQAFPRSSPHECIDSKLLISTTHRVGKKTHQGLILYDPTTGETDYSGVESPLGLPLHSPSPDGRYWLSWDMSSLPTTDARDGPRFSLFRKSGTVTRYYGKVIQLWSAFPLKFERRIVSEWLHLDDLTDVRKSHSAQSDHDNPTELKRDIWDTIATTSAKCGAGPTSEVPRVAFPMRYSGDNPGSSATTWTDISKNWRELAFNHATVMGWQSDSMAFWTHRAGFLSCVGVDGKVSPRLMLERHPLNKGSTFRSTESVRTLIPLENRRAIAKYWNGEALIDGSAKTTSFEPIAISEVLDHWRDTTAEREAMKARIEAEKDVLRIHTVPLKSWSATDSIAAIDAVTDFVGPDFHSKIDEYHFSVVFVMGEKKITEREFFEHVAQSVPDASPALRRLIEAYIATQVGYLYSVDDELEAFGYAVRAMATIDDSTLSILPRYHALLDTSNLTPFGLKTVPAVPRTLGWTNPVIDFVVWYLMTEYWEGLRSYPMAWKEWGMGDAVMATLEPEDFARRHEVAIDSILTLELAAEFDESPYDEILARLGPSISERDHPWVQSFLTEMERIFEANRNDGKWSDKA